ncbi:hypothetical protein KO516_22640 [Citreicella sp. C3M06]|uniref:replication initiation protein RepC n=1 Tax=Citreicella sp. C3M06 TaxID=2841564 RepID=UPI001C081FD6|nr:replication initiation protein RepC [Citreicella sp. C3M06]MBU2963575.1 hypothetical protein [Citreicella sp. C3M06]
MTSVGSGFGPHIQPKNQHNLVKQPDVENQQAATAETPRPDSPDPQTVLECRKDFTAWARTVGGPLRSWPDLHRIAGQLRPMIGITAEAWNSAQHRLGTATATAALALIFEKFCRGEISSPTGYLSGMIRKAGIGELHLTRSLHGRRKAMRLAGFSATCA